MFRSSKPHGRETQRPDNGVELSTLADAQDGSEILFAVARLLERNYGREDRYTIQVRQTANAIRDITDQLQPWVVANEDDRFLQEMWQEIAPRDDVMGAGQHRAELAYKLGVQTT